MPNNNRDDQLVRQRMIYRDGEAAVSAPSLERRTLIGLDESESVDWFMHDVAARPAIETVDEMATMECEAMEEPDWEEPERYEEVHARDFTAYDIPRWPDADERERAANDWFRQMEHRIRWIFNRDEREGVNRTRYVPPFSPDDFDRRVQKSSVAHPMDTDTNKFYDWNIGGAEFILRLEKFKIKGRECLRCHFIYKPNGLELTYEDRLWDGGQNYIPLNQVWANT